MLLKPSPELLRPHSFSLPRLMATNLAYLPCLQESDVICFSPNQVCPFFLYYFSKYL